MSDRVLDCAAIREGDYADRYVAGSLSDPEAEAFEAHFFACDACWDEVQTALEVRAAVDPRSAMEAAANDAREAARARSKPGRRGRGWMGWAAGVAAAAVAAFLFFNVYAGGGDGPEEVFRGPDAALDLEARVAGGALIAEWAELPDADIYVARVYTGDGRLLVEREVSAPRAEVATAALSDDAPSGLVYWRVVALDSLRRPVARSALVRVRLPAP